MKRQHLLLLLLSLGAAVCAPRVSAATYSLAWDSDVWTGLANTTTVPVSGVLQCDAGNSSCQAVAGVQVSVSLSGVGQLAVDSPPAQVKDSTSKKTTPPAKSGIRTSPVASTVTATTDASGAFVVLVSSPSNGDSIISASVTIDNTTVDSNTTATVSWYTPIAYLQLAPEYGADTVGNTQTLTAELRLVAHIPSRSAPKQGNLKAAPRQDSPPAWESQPVSGALLTFNRDDQPSAAKKMMPKPSHPATPQNDGTYQEFATATTLEDGKATVTLTSPPVPADTFVQVVYTDSDGLNTTAITNIAWFATLPGINATSTSTSVGDVSNVTVTIFGEDGITPLANTPLNFIIAGNAIVVEEASRAPSTRDTSVSRTTDANGQATISLRSDSAGSSTVSAYYLDPNGRRVTTQPLTIEWTQADPSPNFSKIDPSPRYQEAPLRRRLQVSALVLDASESPVKGVTVHFTTTRQDGPDSPMFDQAAAAAAAEPAAQKEAVSDENGRAVITLQSWAPGLFQVVAAAENNLAQLVSSEPVLVRFYPAGDYPKDGHHGSDDYAHHKQPHRDHGYDSRKHGRKPGNRRPGYANTDNLEQ